ncbi:A-kinase anchor protein 14-like [Vespa crabro]|uniref:A-kinase anchor protein 14-like n=1 Tax=Vespa crabro TaxID=7445 RepID=UPI001F0279FE|nr:A-kinase anchor protein 14-like [Vespa crabro]
MTYNFLSLIEDYDLESRFNIKNFVRQFINTAIMKAMRIISDMDDSSDIIKRRNAIVTRSLSPFGVEWHTCGSISVNNIINSIKNEMQAWNNLPELKDWMFNVEFISLSAGNNTHYYKYEVVWSVPTESYPEPQVTVTVLFDIAVNFNYPAHYPVDVTYTFEASKFVHRLDMIFQPKWLYDILDMKTIMFKSFDF